MDNIESGENNWCSSSTPTAKQSSLPYFSAIFPMFENPAPHQTLAGKNFAHVDGGPSRGSSVRRPGSEDPYGVIGHFHIIITFDQGSIG